MKNLHCITLLLLCLSCATIPGSKNPVQPKLVLFLTVDQLRADIFDQLRPNFGKGGFRRLIEQGLYFKNAHHSHASTFTATGHATLVTGANPPEHGVVGNDWFDHKSGKDMYCVADPVFKFSPANLLVPTIGDQLLAAGKMRKVFGISQKDRSAILPGGKKGKSFWYSKKNGEFESSTYYYPALPAWAAAFNQKKLPDTFKGKAWSLSGKKSKYLLAKVDNPSTKRPKKGVNPSFPHYVPEEGFYDNLISAPFSDEVLIQFALELIKAEELGKSANTDMLAISFSATDYIGHVFGPFSLEYEDNLYRLDRQLELLFSKLDQAIGMQNVLVVLSSDHGGPDTPENLHKKGLDAGRFGPPVFMAKLNQELKREFKLEEDLLAAFWNPGLFLKQDRIKALGLDLKQVRAVLKAKALAIPGVAKAFTHDELERGSVDEISVLRSFYPGRSGDVVLVQKEHWYLYHEMEAFASVHGSPYAYDTHVPVLMAGSGVPSAQVERRIDPRDIAPTLAWLFGLSQAKWYKGTPFLEVLEPK